MCGAKTALRESFCTTHVGFSHENANEDIKIETDWGQIGVEERVPVSIFPWILGTNEPAKYFKNQCFIILAMDGANF